MTGHAESVRTSSMLLDDVDRIRLVDASTGMSNGRVPDRPLPAGRLGALLSFSDLLTPNERRMLAIDIAERPPRPPMGMAYPAIPGTR